MMTSSEHDSNLSELVFNRSTATYMCIFSTKMI